MPSSYALLPRKIREKVRNKVNPQPADELWHILKRLKVSVINTDEQYLSLASMVDPGDVDRLEELRNDPRSVIESLYKLLIILV